MNHRVFRPWWAVAALALGLALPTQGAGAPDTEGARSSAPSSGDSAGPAASPLPPPGIDVTPEMWDDWSAAAAEAEIPGPFLNALALERSPYLLQHANNPVNWQPWNDAVLEKARADNALIFLSIGYSTCHWCHVMNHESFSDADIARQINRGFVAIKVDREELPVVDRYYAHVLETVKGSAGWPLTAILDAQARPLFIDAYLEPGALSALLTRATTLAENRPDALRQNAEFLSSMVSSTLTQDSTTQTPVSAAELTTLSELRVRHSDSEYGGLQGNQKFPQESALLFLAEMALRFDDTDAEAALHRQLSAMAQGGIWDAVNGGFFRYSTDRYWYRPHYEKMLYNQGLLLRAYAIAHQLKPSPLYRSILDGIEGFLESWLMRDDHLWASALSADSNGSEGAFYLYTTKALSTLEPYLVAAAGMTTYPGPGGLRGVRMAAPYTPASAELRTALSMMAAARERPFRDNKALTAWNSLALSGLVASARHYSVGEKSTRLARLEQAGDQLWISSVTTDGTPPHARVHRVRYSEHDTVEGSLEDYSFLLLALLDLYDATDHERWRDRALLLGRSLAAYLGLDVGSAPAPGQASSAIPLPDRPRNTTGTADVIGTTPMADGELPAPEAAALEGLWRLWRRSGAVDVKRALTGLVDPVRRQFRARPDDNLYAGQVLARLDLGDHGQPQFFAGGRGRVHLTAVEPSNAAPSGATPPCAGWALEFEMDQGWHINSASPLQDYLLPTRVHANGLVTHYPEPTLNRLGFADAVLSLYEKTFRIALHPDSGQCPTTLEIVAAVQACSDRLCLPPETITMKHRVHTDTQP